MKSIFKLWVLAVLTVAGCNVNHSNESDDEHGHEQHAESITHEHEHKLMLTAYSPEFEIFAEADPFVIGKSSGVLSHFSTLSNFKALENGIISVKLNVNGTQVSESIDQPTQKGIYNFTLKPEVAGKGQLEYSIKATNGTFQITIPNVEVYATEEGADEAMGHAEVPAANTIKFTKEQSWKIDFETAKPTVEPFGQVIKTTAQVQPAQTDEVVLTSKAGGNVNFNSDMVVEGKDVKAGDVLLTVEASGMGDDNSAVKYTEAKNNYEKAKVNYGRALELSKDKFVSDKDLLELKNEYGNTKVLFDNLSKNFNADGQQVKSGINGYISHIFVKNGDYVPVGQPIFSIIRSEKLYLKADVQPRFASVLGDIKSANIRANGRTFTLDELNGKVISYGKSTNTDNYLIPVTLQMNSNSFFVPGSFVEIYLKTITRNNSLTIPNTAILEEQGNFFVLVQVNPELFEKRAIKLGVTDGLKSEVLGGISANDRVVTKGAIMVKLAQASGALDPHAGHVH
ncbi:MAG: efflux RND transporter periplasmic adaptor subunit [Bacteroidales bacterium]